MKFRKRPVVIEAVQWTGDNHMELARFGPELGLSIAGDSVYISTLEGTMCASKGDWIIKGVKGEYYPCKPEIFAATYEAVE